MYYEYLLEQNYLMLHWLILCHRFNVKLSLVEQKLVFLYMNEMNSAFPSTTASTRLTTQVSFTKFNFYTQSSKVNSKFKFKVFLKL